MISSILLQIKRALRRIRNLSIDSEGEDNATYNMYK